MYNDITLINGVDNFAVKACIISASEGCLSQLIVHDVSAYQQCVVAYGSPATSGASKIVPKIKRVLICICYAGNDLTSNLSFERAGQGP